MAAATAVANTQAAASHVRSKNRTRFHAGDAPPYIDAVTCRTRRANRPRLECWFYPMEVGIALPEPPLWLTEDLHVPLELEASYEDTCRILRIA